MAVIECYDFPSYTRDERRADFFVHVIGVSLALIAAPVLVYASPAEHRWIAAIYGLSLVAMLSASAAYNISRPSHLKAQLRRFDYSAIFLKIAGGYTPIALGLIGGGHGWTLWAAVWSVALLGIFFKLTQPQYVSRGSLLLYVALGWAIMFCSQSLVVLTTDLQLALVAAGGLTFSVGVLFHIWESLPYQNAIWHVFVLAGSALIYAANWSILTGM